MNAADVAIQFALAQVGKPYKFGATGPNSFDCSGLIQAAYKAAGLNLPRTTYQQILSGTNVNKADLAPGDLVFPDPGHVQLYVGSGNVVEAPHTGAFVQVVAARYWRGRRVTPPGGGIGLAIGSATGQASFSDASAAGAAGCATSLIVMTLNVYGTMRGWWPGDF
jgi:hypothetical protein